MVQKVYCLTLAALMLTVSAAFASDEPIALDVDKDGAISVQEAEVMPELSEQFVQLDVNKDGKLDMVEFAAFKEKKK